MIEAYELRAAITKAFIKRGMRVRHEDCGASTVTRVKKDGTIGIRPEGENREYTSSIQMLSRLI